MAALIDLRATFNSVDRGILGKRLEEEGISKIMRERIYDETRNVMKVREEHGEKF